MAAFSGSMASHSLVGVPVPYFDGHSLVTTQSPNGIKNKNKNSPEIGKEKKERRVNMLGDLHENLKVGNG